MIQNDHFLREEAGIVNKPRETPSSHQMFIFTIKKEKKLLEMGKSSLYWNTEGTFKRRWNILFEVGLIFKQS